MKLEQLLAKMSYRCVQGDLQTEVTGVAYDTRKMQGGEVFVCISGTVEDGHRYIPKALEMGAAALIVTAEVEVPAGIAVVRVEDARKALAAMSCAWFGDPAKKLLTVGITGTKGKTTTAFMIYHMLNEAGISCGLIGTVENRLGNGETIPSSHSTPESYLVQKYFARMVENGCKAVVMEVSSQAFKMSRVEGITFDYGIFTNLEPDHIGPGEHTDFQDYMECKKCLFRQCRTGLFHADAEHVEEMIQGSTCKVIRFGSGADCDYRVSDGRLHNTLGTMGVEYRVSGKADMEVRVDIPGSFNIANSLTALSVCKEIGVAEEVILRCLRTVQVRGRVELVPVSQEFTVMLDYAHNGMALRSLLNTLREYAPKRLVCVFGCGGNRSRDRRFEMGEISSRLADLTIATSDNPRFEEPQDILDDIITGIQKAQGQYVAIIDRREAIRYALEHAQPGDCIVIAGKGHEDYQEIRGVKYPMDDRTMILEEAQKLGLSIPVGGEA